MEQTAQDRNVNLTQVFRSFFANEIQALVHTTDSSSENQHAHDALVMHLRSKITELSNAAGVFRFKLYNLHGITIFSTDANQIGENKSQNPGFVSARNGQTASELVQRNHYSSFESSVQSIDLVSSYIPIVEDGRVTAVVEIYQDVSTLIRRIDAALWQVWLVVLSVLGPLYLGLLLLAHRSQKIQKRSELLLSQVNNELDQRVKERTEALQRSETRFRNLSEISTDFFWETDASHRFTLRTHSKKETGKPLAYQESFIGKTGWEMPSIAPDEAGWQAHRAALDAHLPFRDFEVSRHDANGKLRHISVSGSPRFNADGDFLGYLGVGSDITQRKRIDTDLRITAAAFESQEAMMVTDANSIILRINQAFTNTTGYSAQEAVGQTPRILSSGRHDVDFYRSMWASIQREGVWKGEIWDRRKNGEIYPKWLTISAVKDRTGKVTNYIGTHYDITEQKKSQETIEELAFFDSLTGLPNRTLMRDRLKQAMAGCNRNGSLAALLFIDLDHFKTLNDTFGHDKGDLLLQQVAKRLITSVREGDTVARIGGDEFVVILKNLGDNRQDAAQLTKLIGGKILAELNQTYNLGEVNHSNSASIGATVFTGHETVIDELLKQADLAMYQSKAAGRNALHFFDPAMQRAILERTALESDLREALGLGQLVLHYQPQVSGSGQTIGAEALLRWQHPVRGMVTPVEFIELAEETDLILPMGLWVLETACEQLAQWAKQVTLSDMSLAVNVSARQLRQTNFVEQVIEVIARTGANPQRLKLEITESLLVENLQDVTAKMQALKARGVSFSLDDFGTGYSSLSYLSRLPLDQLKIDRSFVMDLEASENNVALCAAIISMAHGLKLKVVAEGVETDAQRYILGTVHRCDFFQGYLYSRPSPIDVFEAFVQKPVQRLQGK